MKISGITAYRHHAQEAKTLSVRERLDDVRYESSVTILH
jgi:hypothetical protein